MRSARESTRPPSRPLRTTQLTVARSLRTGKIYAAKASASQIQRSVGVRPSEERLAKKALSFAAAAPQRGKARSAKTGKLKPAGKRPTRRAAKR